MSTRKHEFTVQLDNGLIIPTNAAIGKQLLSDSSGNAEWIDPGDEDFLQPGVLGNITSSPITATINSSTRVPTWTNWPTNDIIWFQVSGVMVRGTIAAAPSTAFAAPGASAWRYVSVDAVPPTTFGGGCTYVLTSSADQTTAALAAAAPTSVAAGNVRIWDGIIQNSAGVYSLVSGGSGATLFPLATGRDRRPWARGALTKVVGVTNNPTTTSASFVAAIPEMSARMECTGKPVEVRFTADLAHSVANDWIQVTLWIDGSIPSDIGTTGNRQITPSVSAQASTVAAVWTTVPTAGSHLFQVTWATQAATATAVGIQRAMVVEEYLQGIQNNGTA